MVVEDGQDLRVGIVALLERVDGELPARIVNVTT